MNPNWILTLSLCVVLVLARIEFIFFFVAGKVKDLGFSIMFMCVIDNDVVWMYKHTCYKHTQIQAYMCLCVCVHAHG